MKRNDVGDALEYEMHPVVPMILLQAGRSWNSRQSIELITVSLLSKAAD